MSIKLHDLFTSGMILQRGLPVRVWGSCSPGEAVSVCIQGRSSETAAGADGSWSLELPPLRASSREELTVSSCGESVTLEDVAVGEVFVAGGQSNMEFWMRYEKHYQEVLSDCDNRDIRFYDMPKLSYPGQENDFDYSRVGRWRKASREDLEFFSAAGYYMARKLNHDLQVPVGIIGCSFNGTRSLAWMSEEHARAIEPQETADFQASLAGQSYEEFCRQAKSEPANDTGNSSWNPFSEFMLPRTPSRDEIADFLGGAADITAPPQPQRAPGALYRHMVLRLAPYTVRGVIWYQGESDDELPGCQDRYRDALGAIMADWRAAWKEPRLPFFIVQLPGFSSWLAIENKDYALIRQRQEEAVDADPCAYLCSISDSGEELDIHPKDKLVVGTRLAMLAEKYLFKMDVAADAPRFKSATLQGRTLTISFKFVGSGLYLSGDTVNALELSCGERSIPFRGGLTRHHLVLELLDEPEGPVTVRFARGKWYLVNLYNSGGVPAIPFEVTVQ